MFFDRNRLNLIRIMPAKGNQKMKPPISWRLLSFEEER